MLAISSENVKTHERECQFVISEVERERELVLGRSPLRCFEVEIAKVLGFPGQAEPGQSPRH